MNQIVAYYARVSTNRQEEEETIDSQIAEVVERIKLDGNILGENLGFADDGWSGDLLARPSLDAMRDAAAKKEFEILYIWDRDRIGRKFYLQELILEELSELRIEVVDLHGSKVDSPEDKILLGFKGLFAEYEKAKIGERMRRGKMFKARNGIYMNLQAPYGYNYIPKTKDTNPELTINEQEAEVVRKIFNWIAKEGLTLRSVIKRLHKQKIYPKKHKREVWGNGPLSRLVRNEVYVGTAHYNKSIATVPETRKNNDKYRKIKKSSRRGRPKEDWIPLKVPPIIEPELFLKVHEKLQDNLKFNRRNRKAPYLLTSLVYCICGKRRIGEGVREHRYYRCTDRTLRFPLPKTCTASGVNAFHLDKMVWERLTGLLTSPDQIKKQADLWLKKSKEYRSISVTSKEKLEAELKRLQEEEKRYIKAYGSGLTSFDQLKSQIKEIKEHKELIEQEIEQSLNAVIKPTFDLSQVKNLTQKLAEVIQSLTLDERRILLQRVVGNVSVGDSNKVSIKGGIPLESEAQNVWLWYTNRNSWVAKCWEIYAF